MRYADVCDAHIGPEARAECASNAFRELLMETEEKYLKETVHSKNLI